MVMLMASVAGCTAANDSPVSSKAVVVPVQSQAALPDSRAKLGVHCPKPRVAADTPWMGKIDANLLCAATQAKADGVSFSAMAARMGIVTDKTGVVLDIVTNRLDADVKRKIQLPGVTIRYLSVQYLRVVVVIADPDLLYRLAKISEVRMIMPEYGGRTRGNRVNPGRGAGSGLQIKAK